MNINDIIVGDRVLVQKPISCKEIAVVKEVDPACDLVLVSLSNDRIVEIGSRYIIKSFGQ